MPRQLRVVLGILVVVACAATPAVASAQTATPDPGSANVMVGNFTPNSPLVDIYINGQLLGDNLAFSQATFPAKVRAGSIFIQVFNATTGGLIIDGYKDVGANDYYMVPVMNVLERIQFGAYRIPVYEPLAAGETRVQFFHAIPQAPRLDVLNRTTNTRLVDALGYVEDPDVVDHLAAGTHNWQVWTNNKTIFPGFLTDPNAPPDQLVFDTGNLVLNSGVIYSFFAIGSPTGQLRILALAMPLGGGNPVAPPSASGGGIIGGATPTRTPVGYRTPTPTRTPTPGPTAVKTNTPVPTAGPAPVVSLSSAALSTNEGSNFAISVVLDRPSTGTVTVQYTTSNGTAVAPGDYTAVTNQTITFAAGETFKQIVVPIVPDALDEADETANVRLSNPSGAVLGGSFQATFTIIDDDLPPTVKISSVTVPISATPTPVSAISEGQTATVTVTLSAASGRTVNVTLQFGGTTPNMATNGFDYATNVSVVTFAPGTTSQTFTIAVTSDGTSEPQENFTISLVADFATPVAGSGLNTGIMPLTIPAN